MCGDGNGEDNRPPEKKIKKVIDKREAVAYNSHKQKPVIEKSNRSIFVYSEPQMVKVRQRKDRRMAS